MNNKDVYLNVGSRRKDVWVGLDPERKEITFALNGGGGHRYAKAMYDTTENWNNDPLFIPEKGIVVVYSDHGTIMHDGEEITVAGIKIGDGNAYLIDLPFIGDDWVQIFDEHMNDSDIHVSLEEKAFWNNKLNVELFEESLILNRD